MIYHSKTKAMTSEEKAKELYPDRNSNDIAHGIFRKLFIEGWDACSEEKDKEIAALKAQIEKERWIQASERLPELKDADENRYVLAWRIINNAPVVMNYQNFNYRSIDFLCWKPINPPTQ
jgi:hypothetical protein